MPIAKKKIWDELNDEQALDLKERCVAFRARHMEGCLPEYLKPPYGRLGDIIQPLGIIMRLVAPDKEDDFKKLLKTLWVERLESKSQSREARIIKAVDETCAGLEWVSISAITDKYNAEMQLNRTLSTDSVGRTLKNLGFKGARKEGSRGVIAEPEMLKELKIQHGLMEPEEVS